MALVDMKMLFFGGLLLWVFMSVRFLYVKARNRKRNRKMRKVPVYLLRPTHLYFPGRCLL